MYRVLLIVLLSCIPAAISASTLPHDEIALRDAGVTHTGAPQLGEGLLDEPSPFGAAARYALWDPLGTGCIDPADPAAWWPDGRRDPDAGALCVPEPCDRLLTPEELEYPILGRPVIEGEWEVYVARHAAACEEEQPDSAGLDVLPEDGVSWSELARSPDLAMSRGFRTGHPGSGVSSGGRGVSFPGGSSGGLTPGALPGATPNPGGTGPHAPAPDGGEPRPSDPADPLPPVLQPTPVPLPGSLGLLLAGLAALPLTRR